MNPPGAGSRAAAADFSLYLVTDPILGGGPDKVAGIVRAALSGGVTVVQLRDKHSTDAEFADRARQLQAVTGDVPLFVNDRVDIACELGLHLHIGQTDGSYTTIRRRLPAHLMLGLSIDSVHQLDACLHECAANRVPLPDVIGIGPVEPTGTKPDAAAPLGVAGVGALAAKAADHGIASVAIGGVGVHNAAALAAAPVDGICVVSAIMASADPAAASRRLRRAFSDNR